MINKKTITYFFILIALLNPKIVLSTLIEPENLFSQQPHTHLQEENIHLRKENIHLQEENVHLRKESDQKSILLEKKINDDDNYNDYDNPRSSICFGLVVSTTSLISFAVGFMVCAAFSSKSY